MTKTTESIDTAIPAMLLDLGRSLLSRDGFAGRRDRADQGASPTTEDHVLGMVKASPAARKAIGIRERGQNDAERRLRIRVFACLAWRALRESSCGHLDVAETAATASNAMDPTMPAGKGLLEARHGIGRMLAESVLLAIAENQCSWNPRLFLPAKSLIWASGGRDSLALMTPQRLANAMLSGGGKTDADGDGMSDGMSESPVPEPLPAKTIRDRISARVSGMEDGGLLDVVSGRLALHMARARLIATGKDPGTPNEIILVLGESGTGKTFLCEQAGLATGLPQAVCNAAELTASGYVGLSAEDSLRNLLASARGRIESARFGLMTYDEITKRAASQNDSPVNSTGVLNELLRILQGQLTQVGGKRSNYEPSFWINTYGTFFFLCGHAPGLDRLIERRLGCKAIGFDAGGVRRGTRGVLLDALEDYGLTPELLNRLTAIVAISPPSLQDLAGAAASGSGIIACYNTVLAERGCKLFFQEEAVEEMAARCLATRAYYRGIAAIVSALAADAVAHGVGDVVVGVGDVCRIAARMDDAATTLLAPLRASGTAHDAANCDADSDAANCNADSDAEEITRRVVTGG